MFPLKIVIFHSYVSLPGRVNGGTFPKLGRQRRLLHFVAAGELEQGCAALAEEVQGGVGVQHLDGVLPQMELVPAFEYPKKKNRGVLMCFEPS